ncbi:MAG: SMC-Scp complex subunit ScpB [Hyphomicrobiaceae bacterium]|nr:SMC-Scp complex subunit ScpB [Hyphomicrobiaceae bacterium]
MSGHNRRTARQRNKLDQVPETITGQTDTPNPDAPSPAPPAPRGRPLPSEIATLPSADRRSDLRIIEARLFASDTPLTEADLATSVSPEADIKALLDELKSFYAGRGVNLVRVAGKWAFRTARDLAFVMERHAVEERRLSRAALETLAIVAYHQPATRAEIEEIRGVTISKGTLDVLLETGWLRTRGRRRAPGKPLTYGTTDAFLAHFGLSEIGELPGLAELKAAGLLDATLPPGFQVPLPQDIAALMPDELPIEDEVEDTSQVELEFGPVPDEPDTASDESLAERDGDGGETNRS